MNNLFFSRFCGLLLLCSIGVAAFAQKGYKRAYTLFNAEGKEIGYDELIEALAQPDVVFIGEIHNCCITHWLEYEITRSLYAIHKEKLMLGAEMLEADNQLILDEYMSRAISYDRFEAEAGCGIIIVRIMLHLSFSQKRIKFHLLQLTYHDAMLML